MPEVASQTLDLVGRELNNTLGEARTATVAQDVAARPALTRTRDPVRVCQSQQHAHLIRWLDLRRTLATYVAQLPPQLRCHASRALERRSIDRPTARAFAPQNLDTCPQIRVSRRVLAA